MCVIIVRFYNTLARSAAVGWPASAPAACKRSSAHTQKPNANRSRDVDDDDDDTAQVFFVLSTFDCAPCVLIVRRAHALTTTATTKK